MRQVFLTGATGTIGSALVPRLLEDPDTTVVVLVRAANESDLAGRMDRMLAFWNYEPGSSAARRVHAVRGDISEPDFGLGGAALKQVTTTITHIIHCAASVNLNMTLERARSTAVVPTRTVIDFGRRGMDAGALRKIDIVSTVGVWGRTRGVMPERRLPEVREFHNTYEAAKAEAERVIWAEGADLPITVHRPSMVVGETGSGRVFHFQIFYHLCEFLSGARTFGIMPNLGSTRLDTIPVDWVARTIDWSSRHPQTIGQIFHLCSGPADAIALPRLQARVRSAWQQHGRKLPALRRVDPRVLQRLVPLIGMLTGEKTRRALRALPPVLAYLAEDQAFSNTETARVFESAAMPVPKIETYLDAVLGHYLDHRRSESRP